ncbi:4Fe-4S dicluster domain-containing protein [Sesbania bispinosa]|nr:4Fe-4S dicluster domain-containing protein [Sesbania bispinosa]
MRMRRLGYEGGAADSLLAHIKLLRKCERTNYMTSQFVWWWEGLDGGHTNQTVVEVVCGGEPKRRIGKSRKRRAQKAEVSKPDLQLYSESLLLEQNSKEIVNQVWLIGQALGVIRGEDDLEMIHKLIDMEKGDRRVIGMSVLDEEC